MWELEGSIKDLSVDFKNNRANLTLSIANKQLAMAMFDQLSIVKRLSIKISKYKEKRSLDANSYAWTLIGKIADILRISKDECYVMMLKRYGQGAVAKIPSKYAEDFIRAYQYVEKHEKLEDEKNAQYFRFWVGSSKYNTEEMSIFIDGIVSEAKDMGIQTMTPNEIANMMSLWQQEENN